MSKKKRMGKSKGQSKGIVGRSAKNRTSFGMRRLINQLDAYRAGKNVKVVRPTTNNNKEQFETVSGALMWGKTPEQRKKEKLKNEG